MKLEVKIVSELPDGAPPTERQSATVETHSRRGDDMFDVQRADQQLEGSSAVYNVPNGGRLVITTPDLQRKVVMDNDQNASVRVAQQTQSATQADKPVGADVNKPSPTAIPTPPQARPAAQGTQQPRVQTHQAPPQPGATRTTPPPAPNPTPPPQRPSTDGTADTRDKK